MATNTLGQLGQRQPKDFALRNVLLLSSVSSIDLKLITEEVSYNEDIFGNVCSGYLFIVEAMGYIETLAMNGTEYLRLTFSKADDTSNQIDKVFRIYKLAKRKLEGTPARESYVIYFCSEELLLSEQYKMCNIYKNQTISYIVNDILTNPSNHLNIPKSKIGTIEQTYGQYSLVVPTIKPFDAINWVQIYARANPSNPGSDMLCFENKYGFNFRSLQTLMKQTPYFAYNYKPKNIDSKDLTGETYNVTTYEILDSFDTLKGINSGTFANRLLSVNVLTRQVKKTDFDYGKYQTQSKKLNPYTIIDNSVNRNGDQLNQTPRGLTKLVFSNFDNKNLPIITGAKAEGTDIFAETYIPYRTAQLQLANYTRLRISLPGDPNLTIGQVITFNLPSRNPSAGTQSNPIYDKYYSGNYLITGVRHLITKGTEFTTILEITKESVPTPYPANDNSSALWNNTVKGNY
jgi:hypothetical protein